MTYTASIQDDPYVDIMHGLRQEEEALRAIKHEAWMQGWYAGSRIGGSPTSPYRPKR